MVYIDRFCSTNFNVYAEFEQGRSEFEGVRTRMHTLSKRREGELILMILTSRPFDLKFHLKKKKKGIASEGSLIFLYRCRSLRVAVSTRRMNLIFRYMYIYIGEYGKIEIAAAAIFITGIYSR